MSSWNNKDFVILSFYLIIFFCCFDQKISSIRCKIEKCWQRSGSETYLPFPVNIVIDQFNPHSDRYYIHSALYNKCPLTAKWRLSCFLRFEFHSILVNDEFLANFHFSSKHSHTLQQVLIAKWWLSSLNFIPS